MSIYSTRCWSSGEVRLLWNNWEFGYRKIGTINRFCGGYFECLVRNGGAFAHFWCICGGLIFCPIIVSCVLYIAGLGIMTLSASSECKSKSKAGNNLQIMFFFASFYLVALAQGGYVPCVQAFGADQFDEEDENECKAKSSFFNWWCCFSVGGIVVPVLVLTYIQDYVSWVLGFGIPTVVMCFSLVVFLTGSTRYRFRMYADKRNPIVRIYRVFVKAAKNWYTDGQLRMPHKGSQFKFLDKALLAPDGLIDDEKICSIGDVEDAKSILKLWCSCLGYTIIACNLIYKTSIHIRPSYHQHHSSASSELFISVFVVISLTIYDRIFVPVAREITRKPSGITKLQRIGIGLVLSLIAIVSAAVVERKRLVNMVWWMIQRSFSQ